MQQRRRPSGSNEMSLHSLRRTLAAVRSVLNLPTFIIIVIAALDSADKGLLASSFPMLLVGFLGT